MSNAPSRPSTSTTIAWGMVSIPVSIYTGTDYTGVARKEFTREGVAVGRAITRKDTGEVISRDDVVKMAEVSNGAWVELTDDEVATITQPENRCEVVSFIPLGSIGTRYVTEALYQVRPKANKGHVEPVAAQGFALFLTAMERHNCAALIKIAMRGPARYAAILPDGSMFTLLYSDGIREALPLPEAPADERMLALADTLIESIGIDTPELVDVNGPAIQAFVDTKASGKAPTPPRPTEAVAAPDLMESLMASVKAGKTPVKRSKGKGKAA